jgi:hypothetical protein
MPTGRLDAAGNRGRSIAHRGVRSRTQMYPAMRPGTSRNWFNRFFQARFA